MGNAHKKERSDALPGEKEKEVIKKEVRQMSSAVPAFL